MNKDPKDGESTEEVKTETTEAAAETTEIKAEEEAKPETEA